MKPVLALLLALTIGTAGAAESGKLSYKDFVVWKTTKAEVESALKAGKCQWRVEKDYNFPDVIHYRIDASCFQKMRKHDLVDIVFNDRGMIDRKGVLYFDTSKSEQAAIFEGLKKRFGPPNGEGQAGNIPVFQWYRNGYIYSYMAQTNPPSAAVYETYAKDESEVPDMDYEKIQKRLARELDFSASAKTIPADKLAEMTRLLTPANPPPKFWLEAHNYNRHTGAAMFVGGWQRTAKDEVYRPEDVVNLFPEGVCTRLSKPHVAGLSCRFGKTVFSMSLVDPKNASLPESQKNLLAENMIVLVERLLKKL